MRPDVDGFIVEMCDALSGFLVGVRGRSVAAYDVMVILKPVRNLIPKYCCSLDGFLFCFIEESVRVFFFGVVKRHYGGIVVEVGG